ncbi:unnamed protein product [Cuscuta europaea]|uniref:Uncharacterized protein n=1 Tax=Cuscuta europaea TaxID=41803 RepID=A0A9P0ZHV8_CUSEU|nr:unnamed protein product [Cuscuta europaea]
MRTRICMGVGKPLKAGTTIKEGKSSMKSCLVSALCVKLLVMQRNSAPWYTRKEKKLWLNPLDHGLERGRETSTLSGKQMVGSRGGSSRRVKHTAFSTQERSGVYPI